jgi:hypothetical protein
MEEEQTLRDELRALLRKKKMLGDSCKYTEKNYLFKESIVFSFHFLSHLQSPTCFSRLATQFDYEIIP